MNPDAFYRSRQGDWAELTRLLDRADKSPSALVPAEIRSMGRLYRTVTSDLALARRDFPRHRVTAYLNQLVARAHSLIYRSDPIAWRRIWRYISVGFPRLYRETAVFTLIAAGLFLIPALFSGLATFINPDSSEWLLPFGAQALRPTIEAQELWIDIPIEERPYTSTFIMTNNIRVSFLAFAVGVLGGVFTVWLMILNGLMLGGLSGLTFHYGVGFELWTFVIGHGVVELSVIFMAGGAGLMLGWAVLRPGLYRRSDALRMAAHKAVRLLVPSVPLLFIAGTIEGFISPADSIPWPVKWGVGLLSGILLYGYLGLAGRKDTA
jgi:uncharacterized membrane protein SpoIIM required for sporulation